MRMEKNATNKVGLIVLVAVVIALVGGGIYYLVSHKDSLNLDWKLTFPWSKKDREETTQTASGQTIKKKEDITFRKPDSIGELAILANARSGCNAFFVNEIKEENNQIILKYRVESVDKVRGVPEISCSLEIYRLQVEGYEVSGTSEITVKEGETKTAEIRIPIQELEKNELRGMNTLTIYYKYKTGTTAAITNGAKNITFNNNKPVDNEKYGITVDELIVGAGRTNPIKVSIEYYKTVTDMDNTYLYFNMYSKGTMPYLTTVRVKKLFLLGKIYDSSDYFQDI